ncbi:hypothetical protein BLX87_01195 [Bacillus sp. VT-16-64]|nr:hypothetical protein BLX87_01195 [Bacillus sp. VT-16-64]
MIAPSAWAAVSMLRPIMTAKRLRDTMELSFVFDSVGGNMPIWGQKGKRQGAAGAAARFRAGTRSPKAVKRRS